jgi:hypothetical protein
MTIQGSGRSLPFSMTRMRPGRSLTKMRPSGAKSIAQGVSTPRTKVSTVYSAGAAANESFARIQMPAATRNVRARILIADPGQPRRLVIYERRRFLTVLGQMASIGGVHGTTAGRLRGFLGVRGRFPNRAQIRRVWIANTVFFENFPGGFHQLGAIEDHRLVGQYA